MKLDVKPLFQERFPIDVEAFVRCQGALFVCAMWDMENVNERARRSLDIGMPVSVFTEYAEDDRECLRMS